MKYLVSLLTLFALVLIADAKTPLPPMPPANATRVQLCQAYDFRMELLQRLRNLESRRGDIVIQAEIADLREQIALIRDRLDLRALTPNPYVSPYGASPYGVSPYGVDPNLIVTPGGPDNALPPTPPYVPPGFVPPGLVPPYTPPGYGGGGIYRGGGYWFNGRIQGRLTPMGPYPSNPIYYPQPGVEEIVVPGQLPAIPRFAPRGGGYGGGYGVNPDCPTCPQQQPQPLQVGNSPNGSIRYSIYR